MADVLAAFWRDSVQVARRDYHCAACTFVILRGERYAYTAAKVDGDLVTLREHTRCHELERRLKDVDGHFLFGELLNAPDYAVSPSEADVAEWASIFGMPWPS